MTGRRYKQDEYGENVRKTGRPPYISVADYKKMSYRQQLKAKLDYQNAQEESIIRPNKKGRIAQWFPNHLPLVLLLPPWVSLVCCLHAKAKKHKLLQQGGGTRQRHLTWMTTTLRRTMTA